MQQQLQIALLAMDPDLGDSLEKVALPKGGVGPELNDGFVQSEEDDLHPGMTSSSDDDSRSSRLGSSAVLRSSSYRWRTERARLLQMGWKSPHMAGRMRLLLQEPALVRKQPPKILLQRLCDLKDRLMTIQRQL